MKKITEGMRSLLLIVALLLSGVHVPAPKVEVAPENEFQPLILRQIDLPRHEDKSTDLEPQSAEPVVPLIIEKPNSIPDAVYYDCHPKKGQICITPELEAQTAIAYSIYNEGGSLSMLAATNLLQLLHNQARTAWGCRPDSCLYWSKLNPEEKPWEEITRPELEQLLLYLLSQPYLGGDGREYPAWNSWGVPLSTETVENNAILNRIYMSIYQAIGEWLDNPSGPIIVYYYEKAYRPHPALLANWSVMYCYSTFGYTLDFLERRYSARDVIKWGEKKIYVYYLTFPFDE